jgi:hypothetical protein
MVKVNLQTVTLDIKPQDIITRDNVTVRVNAVTYFNVVDPIRATVAIQDYRFGTSQVAQTTLRSVIGQVDLDELLVNRDEINQRLAKIIDDLTNPVGREGHPGRGQGRRASRGDAPGHGSPGRGRAGAPGKGHPDLRADRNRGALVVPGAFVESGSDPRLVAGELSGSLRRMAAWLAFDRIEVGGRGDLAPALSKAVGGSVGA